MVYPHHGAGKVLKKENKKIFGEERQYLTIKILHNDMTVMVPCENAAIAGLRRIIDEAPDWRPPAHLRAILLGGGHAPPELMIDAADRGWPVLTTYGMTETCSQVVTQP